jgi:hypothetical protein
MKIEIENTNESVAAAIASKITAPELVKEWLENEGEEVEMVDGSVCLSPKEWHMSDGNAEITGEFDSGKEAAQDYVDGGDWGDRSETCWITVRVWRLAVNGDGEIVSVDEDSHKITLEAEEPECTHEDGHDWQSPHEIVGGIKENPGVYGHGGGVTMEEVCMHCGCGQNTDTWAQDPCDGEQGLTSVTYTPGKYIDQIEKEAEEA